MSVLNIAHRGGAGLRPENTRAAFAHAIELGCDGGELDVQLTRDGKVVVFHDFRLSPDLCRDADGAWLTSPTPRICDLTYAELQAFDIGRPRPGSAAAMPDLVPADGERIPLLADIVALARSAPQPFQLFVELKVSDAGLSAPPDVIAEHTLAVARDDLERVVFIGFDWRALLRIKALASGAECWFSTTDRHVGRSSLGAIREAGGEGWFPDYRSVSAENLAEAHGVGLKVGAWTVDEASDMRSLMDLGVDAICTDRPDRLLSLGDAS